MTAVAVSRSSCFNVVLGVFVVVIAGQDGCVRNSPFGKKSIRDSGVFDNLFHVVRGFDEITVAIM